MNDALLMPKLRPAQWPGWNEVAGRALLARPAVGGLPRVGVGEDSAMGFEFLRPAELRAAWRTFSEVEELALENLRRRPAPWTVQETRGGFLGVGAQPVWLEHRDDWASERILDEEFLGEAHRLLRSEHLLMASPTRGVLWARSVSPESGTRSGQSYSSDAAISAWVSRVRSAFLACPPTIEALSSAVLTVRDGRLTGVLSARAAA